MVRGISTVLAALVLTTAAAASAQDTAGGVRNANMLDQALRHFRSAAESWQGAIQGAATTLFWALATISLVWTLAQLVLKRAEFGEIFGELIRFLVFTGFWAWMLQNGSQHARLIMDSMSQLAGQAVGEGLMTPSGVLDIGFHIVDRALTQSTIAQPFDSAFGIVLSLAILVILALVAVNMLVILVSCWVVAYGGIFVLGFGASRWTSDMAINYYRTMLSLGLQVLGMVLIVGIGEAFLRSYYSALEENVGLHEQAVLLVVAILLLSIVNRVPPLLASLAHGGSPQYALGSGAGAGSAMAALSAAGAVAATGVAAATAGASTLVRGAGEVAKATMAAQRHAQTDMSSMLADFGARAGVAAMRGTDSSGGGDDSSGGAGGSVFPAALSSAPELAGAPSASDTPQGISFGEQSNPSSAEPPPASDGERLRERERDAAEAHDEETSSRSTRTAQAEVRAPGGPANESPSGLRSEALDQPGGPSAGAGAAENARSSGDGATASAADSSSASSSSTERMSANGPERALAQTAAPMGSAGPSPTPASTMTPPPPPAGAFASSTAPAPPPAAVSRNGAQAPLGLGRQPAPHGATAGQGSTAAQGSALAAASQQAAAPQELAFSGPAATQETSPTTKRMPDAATADSAERTELPAAYSTETAIDVEAEVAAFRDRS